MKIVVAYGGLGNVMFQYALVNAFLQKGFTAFLFVSDANVEHNGYELEKVFPRTSQWGNLKLYQILYYKLLQQIRKIKYRKKYFPHKILLYPFKGIHRTKYPILFYPELFENTNHKYYVGPFQSYKFFDCCERRIRDLYVFDTSKLSESTKTMEKRIIQTNSVSIHVRRGDYMNDFYIKILGAICDMDYYSRAIKYIKSELGDNVHFFIFSDDKEYAQDLFQSEIISFVDFNIGLDSWQDMYLMSKCKHNIIANSTFSWWGAWLNRNPQKIVVAPSKWLSYMDHDDLVPSEWKRL